MSDTVLITTAQLRARYGGVSHMWVERRLKDNPNFPRPIYIAKRRYWSLNELVTWERSLARRPMVGFFAGLTADQKRQAVENRDD